MGSIFVRFVPFVVKSYLGLFTCRHCTALPRSVIVHCEDDLVVGEGLACGHRDVPAQLF